jgi:hypothetical protein
MKPGGRIAEKLSLHLIGASVSLKIFHTRKKLRWGIFRKVVKHTSYGNTRLKAMEHNLVSVSRYGDEVFDRMNHTFKPSRQKFALE